MNRDMSERGSSIENIWKESRPSGGNSQRKRPAAEAWVALLRSAKQPGAAKQPAQLEKEARESREVLPTSGASSRLTLVTQ